MIELAKISDDFLGSGVWIVSLVFLRVGAAMALLPVFGEQVTPMRIKLAITVAFTVVIAPIAWSSIEVALTRSSWVSMIGIELVSGFIVGILFRLMVHVLQIAGTVAAQSTSLSQMFGGGLGAEPQPAVSTLLVVSGLCLAVMAGLHIRVVEMFLFSYDFFPPGDSVSPEALAGWGIERISHAFVLGLSLAGPFLLASLIYNLALGAINRTMPQLMVAFVGAPAISLGGLVLLMVASPIMLLVWLAAFLEQTSFIGGPL